MTRKATPARGVRSLAELISAVLRHPDTPASLYNSLVDQLSDYSFDVTAPDHVRGWLEQQRREGLERAAGKEKARRAGKRGRSS